VNDGLSIEEVHCGHDAILEFLFGCDADVAQHRAGELGKEPLDQVELDDTISSPSTTIPMVEVLRRRGSSMPVVSR
jgi:hypothetical protein